MSFLERAIPPTPEACNLNRCLTAYLKNSTVLCSTLVSNPSCNTIYHLLGSGQEQSASRRSMALAPLCSNVMLVGCFGWWDGDKPIFGLVYKTEKWK